MAADSAKKTVTQIASDEGEKIVKAISKDLADDAKAEAEKDKLQAEEKKKAEDGEGAKVAAPEGAEVKLVTEGEKTIAIEVQKPAAKTEGGAKVEEEAAPVELKITIGSDGEIKAVSKSVVEGAKPVEKPAEEKTVAPEATEKIETPAAVKTEAPAPGTSEPAAPVVAEKTLDSAKEIPAQAEPVKSIPTMTSTVVEATPAKSESVTPQPEQTQVSAPVVKEVPIPITQEESAKEKAKATEPPVSKSVVDTETKTEPETPAKVADNQTSNERGPVQTSALEATEVAEPEILSVLGIVHSDAAKDQTMIQVPAIQEVSTSEPDTTEDFVQQLLQRSNSVEPVVPVEKVEERGISSPVSASVESVPEVNQEPAVIPIITEQSKKEEPVEVPVQSEESATGTEQKPTNPTEPVQPDAPEAKFTSPESNHSSVEVEQKPIPTALSQAKDLAVSALTSSAVEFGPNVVTAAASVTNITTTTTKTVEVPSGPSVKMVTVSQESLDALHAKLDAMHEAIQHITKKLATHLSAPQAPAPVVVKEVAVEPTPTPTTQAVPEPTVPSTSESAPQEPETTAPVEATNTTSDEITAVPTTSTNPPETQPTTPKRPTHNKRGSVIGSIGKFLWPFGGSTPPPKEATVKASTAEVTGEVEAESQVSKPKSSGKDSAPGPELTKASSTVEVTEVLATPVAV
ncbi:hypothetical protein ONS95_008969 [Cadophora gregata]|uniref:uncharacterized protein n=1 Tax=Cadophora gregata TaxID=51156 RepID=UPI0026DB67EC|nr:uncharacterized protein ONS95_008969 [Cadophora gregata]KAK0123981.1 hypothetical protein ONS95_008969 [Cadophora gregata]KAK0130320.1 hypothetical protein ONS96_000841 [Cadophora gregata f. sp. sojae]